MDKRKLRNWILSGVLINLLVIGLFCLHIFPFQELEMKKAIWDKREAEFVYFESLTAGEIGAQIEEEMAILEESMARVPYIHRLDPTPLLLRGLEEAIRYARASVEKVTPLSPSPEEGKGVTKLSWRITIGAPNYAHLERFFVALAPLPFLIKGEDFSLAGEEGQHYQTQFTIFTFMEE